jgi:hypothetical protein
MLAASDASARDDETGSSLSEGGLHPAVEAEVVAGASATERSRRELTAAYRQQYVFLEAHQTVLCRQADALELGHAQYRTSLEPDIQ